MIAPDSDRIIPVITAASIRGHRIFNKICRFISVPSFCTIAHSSCQPIRCEPMIRETIPVTANNKTIAEIKRRFLARFLLYCVKTSLLMIFFSVENILVGTPMLEQRICNRSSDEHRHNFVGFAAHRYFPEVFREKYFTGIPGID